LNFSFFFIICGDLTVRLNWTLRKGRDKYQVRVGFKVVATTSTAKFAPSTKPKAVLNRSWLQNADGSFMRLFR
jgi:hypothetical protein